MLLSTVNVDQAGQKGVPSALLSHPLRHTPPFAMTAAYYLCILNLLKASLHVELQSFAFSVSLSLSLWLFPSLLLLPHLSLPDTCRFIISVISDISYLF